MTATIIKSIRFLGTGPSSGVPNLFCLATERCNNCLSEKNRRTCVSLLIRTNGQPILIDCGKDFHEQYASFLDIKERNEQFLPTTLITHPHADAITGLDSLMQMIPRTQNLPLLCDKETKKYLLKTSPYLFNTNNKRGLFDCSVLKMMEVNCINGISIVPFHVRHGDDDCVAFLIDGNILYVSDCSSFALEINPRVLIIDCTTYDQQAFGHLNFYDVVGVVKRTKPLKTYLIGMSHKVDREVLQIMANKHGMGIVVAFDGLDIKYEDLI